MRRYIIQSNAPRDIGISMGCALAMILSWSANHSILWAIVHGVCSWFYVIYFWLFKGSGV